MTATNIIQHPSAAAPSLTKDQLALIKRTVAKDCSDDEFNLFIQGYCRSLQLDPLRGQVYAFVYNRDNPAKRKMSVVIGISGFRTVAARTGNYRPGKTRFDTDESLKDPLSNPAGLISATTSVFMFSHGDWHEIEETAYWDECAPMKEDGDFTMVETGEKWPDGNPKKRKQFTGEKRFILDDKTQWPKRPRQMLAKVAEAQALRRAWPDNFSNVYEEEEVARERALEPEILPADAAALGAIEDRMSKINAGKTILIDLMSGENSPLAPVPIGQIADRVCEFINAHRSEPSQIRLFADRNRHGLREFWAMHPGDALDLKKKIEEAINNPPAEVVEGDAQ
jgi:phage recombination protein Bet